MNRYSDATRKLTWPGADCERTEMIHSEGTGEAIYRRLKADLVEGAIDLHSRLDIARLAEGYRVSPTPVREAAMRLLGEGLLDAHPQGGTRPLQISEFALRSILELHGQFSEVAIRLATRQANIEAAEYHAERPDESYRQLFRSIGQATPNSDLVVLFDRLADRLAPFRQVEPLVFANLRAEFSMLCGSIAADDVATLRKAVRAHHKRRLAHVPELAWQAARRHNLAKKA